MGSPSFKVTELTMFEGGYGWTHSTIIFPERLSSAGFWAFQEVSITITRERERMTLLRKKPLHRSK